jgi:hypothetical protein
MLLYRQKQQGYWDTVIAQVKADLEQLAATKQKRQEHTFKPGRASSHTVPGYSITGKKSIIV